MLYRNGKQFVPCNEAKWRRAEAKIIRPENNIYRRNPLCEIKKVTITGGAREAAKYTREARGACRAGDIVPETMKWAALAEAEREIYRYLNEIEII